MFGRRIIFIITRKGILFLTIVIVTLLAVVFTSTKIFAHFENPLSNRLIIIDPGHGGIDGGTNDNESFFEKDINLQISQRIRDILKTNRSFVDMTRETDVSLDSQMPEGSRRHLSDLLARAAQFNSGKYNLFVSVHVNYSTNNKAIGPIVLYSKKDPQSELLAKCLQNRLNSHIKNVLKRDTSRKPQESQFFILQNSDIPGVLIETGFISNPEEKQLLKDGTYQQKLAQAICSGIKDFYSESKNIKRNDSLPQENILHEEIPYNLFEDAWQVINYKKYF
jgi:N-acetylmuramoyl-L-alanine amidase